MIMFTIVQNGNLKEFLAEVDKILKTQGSTKLAEALKAKNASGKTLLHVAAQNGHLELVRELLLMGLVPEEEDADHHTALQLAEAAKHVEIAALLRTRMEWQGQADASFSISKAVSYIEDAFDKIKDGSDKDLVLVIGNTGAGKSTLLNYILGARYKINVVKKEFITELVSGVETARVGRYNTVSQTLYPQVFSCEGQDFVLCDLAGFAETRGKEKAICASSSTQMLTRQAKRIKGILLVLSFDDLKGSKAQAFKEVCKTLYNVLDQDMKLVSSTLHFVFTKSEEYTVSDIFDKYINEILDHEEDGLIAKKGALSEDEKGLYAVLMAMRENKNRILIPDISDNGQSVGEIIAAIRECKPEQKERFNFMNHDPAQSTFNSLMFKIGREYLVRVEKLEKQLPQSILELKQKVKKEDENIALWNKEKIEREEEKNKPFDPKVLEERIEDLKAQKISDRASVTSEEAKVLTKTQEKSAADTKKQFYNTDDQIQETQFSFSRPASTHHVKTGFLGLGSGKDIPDEGEESKAFDYNATCALSNSDCKPSNGHMAEDKITGGNYHGIFRYEKGKDSSIAITLNSTKKVKYADQIQLCDQLVANCDKSIADGNVEITRLNADITRIDGEIDSNRELINTGRLDAERRLLVLDAEIAERNRLINEASEKRRLLIEEIENLQQNFSDVCMELDVNESLFKIAYDVINKLSLTDKNDPEIIENFCNLFKEKAVQKLLGSLSLKATESGLISSFKGSFFAKREAVYEEAPIFANN